MTVTLNIQSESIFLHLESKMVRYVKESAMCISIVHYFVPVPMKRVAEDGELGFFHTTSPSVYESLAFLIFFSSLIFNKKSALVKNIVK